MGVDDIDGGIGVDEVDEEAAFVGTSWTPNRAASA
jgi:hypothetical protein